MAASGRFGSPLPPSSGSLFSSSFFLPKIAKAVFLVLPEHPEPDPQPGPGSILVDWVARRSAAVFGFTPRHSICEPRAWSARTTYDQEMPVDPSNLTVCIYPDPALRQKAAPVPAVTDEVRKVAAAMITLMRKHDGIGLAATQVAIPWRMFIADVPPSEKRSPETDPPSATKG